MFLIDPHPHPHTCNATLPFGSGARAGSIRNNRPTPDAATEEG